MCSHFSCQSSVGSEKNTASMPACGKGMQSVHTGMQLQLCCWGREGWFGMGLGPGFPVSSPTSSTPKPCHCLSPITHLGTPRTHNGVEWSPPVPNQQQRENACTPGLQVSQPGAVPSAMQCPATHAQAQCPCGRQEAGEKV